jgi:arylsulfatase A
VGKSGAGMYGDFTMMVDAEIGRILAALDKSGLAGDTLVIFTSDNGPTWYEADVERLGHASAGGWRGMKSDAWEGGHRMPFIVRWPGRVKAGTVSEQTICFTDLLATFAEICGASRCQTMRGRTASVSCRCWKACSPPTNPFARPSSCTPEVPRP